MPDTRKMSSINFLRAELILLFVKSHLQSYPVVPVGCSAIRLEWKDRARVRLSD